MFQERKCEVAAFPFGLISTHDSNKQEAETLEILQSGASGKAQAHQKLGTFPLSEFTQLFPNSHQLLHCFSEETKTTSISERTVQSM